MTKCAVAFICDNHYVIPTAVAITSLIFNKDKESHYDIYLIVVGLSDGEIEKFYELRGKNTEIHVIKASLDKFKGLREKKNVTAAAYLKFDLPDLIPDLDKVLYLDSDVIVRKDLSGLYATDMGDYYACAVKDMPVISRGLNLHLKDYFNSGVMLINLKLMRANDASAALFIIRKAEAVSYMDQTCFNIVFDKRVKFLPIKYNYFYNLFLQEKEKYPLADINKFFGTNYSALEDIKKDSYIIHIAGGSKPWIYYDCNSAHEWDEYFKKSPFKYQKLKRKSLRLIEFKKKLKTGMTGKIKNRIKETLRLFANENKDKKKAKQGINKREVQRKIDEFKSKGVTPEKRNPKLIVSLTSFPQRMYDIHFALYSLLNQKLKPDEVVLWLGEEEYPNKEGDLPSGVLELKKNGLTIKWSKDIKSYQKLVPTLMEYPEDVIITADDDIYYPPNWLELLYTSYLKNPRYIHCHRAHRITFDENHKINQYSKWIYRISDVEPSFCNFITGAGGVLYPPKSLHEDVLSEELFLKLSPTADDIWFWAMAVLNKTRINVVKNNITTLIYTNIERELGLTDEDRLFQKYNIGDGNDNQLRNIFNHYTDLKNNLESQK